MTILVMDNDPDALKQITSILEKNKFHTFPVRSVNQAVDQLQSHLSISMIFTEINMPENDGFELLRFLRANLRFSHIPVIICTMAAETKSVVHSVGLGAKDYIIKPIEEEKLISTVNRTLEARQGTVLVVGNDDLTIKILAQTLEREGYNARIALSGESATTFLESQTVDAVISEFYLEGMSGLDLLVTIKEKDYQTPVIFVVDQLTSKGEETLIAAGADGWIKKPFNNFDIRAKILALKRIKKKKVTSRTEIARKLVKLEMSSKEK